MAETSAKEKGAAKTARYPIKIAHTQPDVLPKPPWIRIKANHDAGHYHAVKQILRQQSLHTVCEEASCPNIGECFGKGTAAFMILGDICTRRCPFCNVSHGKPLQPDASEPAHLARTVAALKLGYVVITSVDRDDLRDGGAQHFADCIAQIRLFSPQTSIEILVPDFRGRLDTALQILTATPPDVLNHNLETVPRLYKNVRPGADYTHSLALLGEFKAHRPEIRTKSGLMVGLGEADDEILKVMRALRAHNVDMLTIGQYLAPSREHLPVRRYVPPEVFEMYGRMAQAMGFSHTASAPMVRSSYHADQQTRAAGILSIPTIKATEQGF